MSDEYELLPSDEIAKLREEVAQLKRNPLGNTQASIGLLDGMNKLSEQIARLVQVLESANDDMVKAFHDMTVQEQLQRLREENAKIGQGIVALADLIKEHADSTTFSASHAALPPATPPAFVQPQPQLVPMDTISVGQPHEVIVPLAETAPRASAPQQAQPATQGTDAGRKNPFLATGQKEYTPIITERLPHPGEPIPPPPPR